MCDDFMEDLKRCLKQHPKETSELIFEAWARWFVDTLNQERMLEELDTGKDRLTIVAEMLMGEGESKFINHKQVRDRLRDIIRAVFAHEQPPGPFGELLERRRRESLI